MKSNIIYFGKEVVLSCDGECSKAWGRNWHGKKCGEAPSDPGIYEGSNAKPTDKTHNKWCARSCERSHLIGTKPLDSVAGVKECINTIYGDTFLTPDIVMPDPWVSCVWIAIDTKKEKAIVVYLKEEGAEEVPYKGADYQNYLSIRGNNE